MAIGAMARLDARGIGVTSVRANLLAACRDKRAANELALAAGLHVPATRAIADAAGLDSFVQEFGYPVIVKPVRSNAKLFGRKAYIVRDTHEQAARFETLLLGPDDQLDELLKLEPPILEPPPLCASTTGANEAVAATMNNSATNEAKTRVCKDFII